MIICPDFNHLCTIVDDTYYRFDSVKSSFIPFVRRTSNIEHWEFRIYGWAMSIVYYICETSHLWYPFPFFHHISGLNSVFVIHSILGHSFSFSILNIGINQIMFAIHILRCIYVPHCGATVVLIQIALFIFIFCYVTILTFACLFVC